MELHGRGGLSGGGLPVARNLNWGRFVSEMRARGVAVFDPTPAVLRSGEPPRFLVQDTHWTPEWLESVADELAAFVTKTVDLRPPASPFAFKRVPQSVECLGDVAVMLKLPQDQRIFLPQRVTIHQVQDADGTPWEPDPKGDVLLLGDSFTNVFSMEPMGWGTSAGLGAQLALAFGRGIDVIAQNDSGAFATRMALADAIRAGEDRLAGKKAVIWEFASRELSVGDWKPIDWSAAQAGGAQ
jgi:alginate O-acetyltransferase complex protein AlgJ